MVRAATVDDRSGTHEIPERSVWAGIYRATYTDLVRYIHRSLRDLDRAQDLAQEAFMRALPHTPENPRAWLFTVAANLVRAESRRASVRKRHLHLLRNHVEPATASPDLVDAMARQARRERVERALAQLTERDREAILLWDAGLSYTEIAEQTGLALGSVGTTLARARRRMAEAYRSMERDDDTR